LLNKNRTGLSGTFIPTSSFRLPPPLSSPIINSSSTRTRSLENINSNEGNQVKNFFLKNKLSFFHHF